MRERVKYFVLGPILNLPDYGRLKFVQNTWAGVDSLVRRLSGSLFVYLLI